MARRPAQGPREGPREDPHHEPHEAPEELAEEVAIENPDPTTRREAYELGLMENDESLAGEMLHVVDDEELITPEGSRETTDRTR